MVESHIRVSYRMQRHFAERINRHQPACCLASNHLIEGRPGTRKVFETQNTLIDRPLVEAPRSGLCLETEASNRIFQRKMSARKT